MASQTFYVSTERTGYDRRVRLVVYDTVKELQVAAHRYNPSTDGFANALAVSQPRVHFTIAEDGSEKRTSNCGTIRFVKGQMGAAIVSHEMVHMALAIYREDFGKASLRNMKNEETLCHIVSDLADQATNKFWKAGLYGVG
jgi:hypothetical protein